MPKFLVTASNAKHIIVAVCVLVFTCYSFILNNYSHLRVGIVLLVVELSFCKTTSI